MQFTINVNVYHHNSDSELLKVILHKLNNMPTKSDFDALRTEFNASITNIADDITRLTDSLESGLTAEEETAIFAEFREVADRLNAVAARTPEA